ncbi:histone-lysine N-methyltransferase SETMAR-like [Euwallacea similis]|uniref:histone-lysine N-methyltransferase SETMAR-like n=1 Tax=Euwallacea similis TaxID=1736056 RepID=UPI00344BEC54
MDKTWVHHFTPETKEQSRQWTRRGESALKKLKTVPFAGKVMASVFWNAPRKLRKDNRIWRKSKYCFIKTTHQFTLPSSGWPKINQSGFELFPHPPHSPDLAPSDYFLFSNMEKWLGGKRFANSEEVEPGIDTYLETFKASYYKQYIRAIEYFWEKCVISKETMLKNNKQSEISELQKGSLKLQLLNVQEFHSG